MAQRIRLQKALEIETKTGRVYRIEAAGDGFAIHPVTSDSTTASKGGKRSKRPGRKPAPETLVVRKRMEGDAEKGALEATGSYVALLQSENSKLSLSAARQRVQNERKRILEAYPGIETKKRAKKAPRKRAKRKSGSGATRGRKPKATTLALRKKLADDATSGTFHPVSHYVSWLREQEPGLTDGSALQRVYKERRLVLGDTPKPGKRTKGQENGPAKKGRKAKRRGSPALEALRAKLQDDAKRGFLSDTKPYVDFVMRRDKNIGLKPARQLVTREKAKMKAKAGVTV